MIKIKENKTRKGLRITQCILYLFEIYFCTMPYIQGIASDENLYSYSVLDLISFIGGTFPETSDGEAFSRYIMYAPVFFVIPIVGFFFCALDKQRNMKNIVSLICCLLGVVSILIMVGAALSLGSLLGLLFYLLISFLTTIAMFARITDDSKKDEKRKS